MKLTITSKFDKRYGEDCINEIAKQLNEKTVFVCTDNEGSADVQLDKVCGEVIQGSAKEVDGQITYEVKIYGTDMGRAIKPLLKAGANNLSLGIACVARVNEETDTVDSDGLEVVKGYMELIDEDGNSNIKSVE